MIKLVADPAQPSRLYTATSGGVFRSLDAGASWQRAEVGIHGTATYNAAFALDPNVPDALWITDDTGRLYRSIDAGASWTSTGTGISHLMIRSISAAAGAAGVLYAGVQPRATGGAGGGVYKSLDNGATFSLLPGSPQAEAVYVDPHNSQHILIGASNECSGVENPPSPLYRSLDGGVSWSAITLGVDCMHGYTAKVVFGPAGSHRIYALPGYNTAPLYRSDDDGASWFDTKHYANSVVVSPTSAEVLWLGTGVGVQKSSDGGMAVASHNTGLTSGGGAIPDITALTLHANYPATPTLWAATANAGMFVSSTDGALWNESNDGLSATHIRALAVHPAERTQLYAGVGDAWVSRAVYRSTSAGGWNASNNGLQASQLRAITIDPGMAADVDDTVIYASGSGLDWSGGNADSYNSGLYKSSDGGSSWSTLDGGFPELDNMILFRSLALDPRSCIAPPPSGPCHGAPLQTVYAAGSGINVAGNRSWRIAKSTDAGAHWTPIDASLPDTIVKPDGSRHSLSGVVPMVIDPTNPQTLYIGTFATANGSNVSPDLPSGVFKSSDGGATWINKSAGLPRYPGSTQGVLDVLSLAIHPQQPHTLWASTIDLQNQLGEPGLIYKTIDGGENWFLSNAGINAPDTRALLVDPGNPAIVYTAGGGIGVANPGGVFKSSDGGANWKSISVGLPSSSASALALDPTDSSILHAGTMAGVFSLTQLPDADDDGVPDVVENAGPNGGDADGDGIADALQATVSTSTLGALGLSGWQAGQGEDAIRHQALLQQALDAGMAGGYFTVKLIDGDDCQQSVDVAPVDPAPHGVDQVRHHGRYDYPRGLVRFELSQCSEATVDVIFHAAQFDSNWSWRYYGPSTPGDATTLNWHAANQLVSQRSGNTFRLQLRAGEFGSYRPAGSQSILFVGGPAENETLFNHGFDD